MPGVVNADVSCSTGKAVCQVKPGTSVDLLVQAVEGAGFPATPQN